MTGKLAIIHCPLSAHYPPIIRQLLTAFFCPDRQQWSMHNPAYFAVEFNSRNISRLTSSGLRSEAPINVASTKPF